MKGRYKMENLVKDLNKFLSDLAVFYRKLQNYHWNIKGPHFFTLHEKLENYYDEINEQIDVIAEHILMLGYEPLGTIKDYLATTSIKEAKNEKVNDSVVIENLVEDYTILLQEANKIKKLADDKEAYATSSLIDDNISNYMKNLWMLKQLKGE